MTLFTYRGVGGVWCRLGVLSRPWLSTSSPPNTTAVYWYAIIYVVYYILRILHTRSILLLEVINC